MPEETAPAQPPATPGAPAPGGATAVQEPPTPASVAETPAEQPAAEATPAPAAPATPSNGKKILIVEDEKPLSHALQLKLGNSGYDITVVDSGALGLEEASSGKYDLLLLDLIVPGMDGFTLLEKLREKEPKLPVVIISNLGQEEDKQRVEKFNIHKYCVKSNTPLAQIVDVVKDAFGSPSSS